MSDLPPDTALQRAYYASGAHTLDPVEGIAGSHDLPIALLKGYLGYAGVSSLLDVGAGTGRTLSMIREAHPGIELRGIEPTAELRRISVERWGLAPGQIADGDATKLPFADKSFDLVTAFGILHHIKDHGRAVSELARVARKGVFISDVNCYDQGNKPVRMVKHVLRELGLWNAATFVRSRGKGYFVSEGGGLYYSYSLVDDLPILHGQFEHVILNNPRGRSIDHYRDAPYLVAIARDRLDREGGP